MKQYYREFFDKYHERRGTRSTKWDGCHEKFNINPSIDIVPMWIADMDFQAPEKVVSALQEKVSEGIYGYSIKPESFYNAVINWVKKRYNWSIQKEWIIFTPGVIPGFILAIQSLTLPGDGIIVQTPVYYPFMDGVRNNQRVIVENKLLESNGYYTIDFEDLERKARDPKNKLLILSNPHNPVGRVWTPDELNHIGNICSNNNVFIVSDEIHADLMMHGNKHTPLASLSTKFQECTITNYAPSKTFNLAGLQTAVAVIQNPKLREIYLKQLNANRIFNINFFGGVALETAYSQCDEYVDSLCEYVDENISFMSNYLKEKIPVLKMTRPEGTYLVWVDFRDTGMSTEEIERFIVEKAHIAVDVGSWFGNNGSGFLRFNLACPRLLLERAMKQLDQAMKGL